MWAGPQATTPAPTWSAELLSAGRKGPPPVSPQVSPRTLSRAHVIPVPPACRPSVLPPATSALPGPLPRPVAPEAPQPRQAGRDAAGPAALTRRGRGRPRPAEPGRAHLLAAAVQDPGPGRAALGGVRAELEREVPDRVPGKEPHRFRRRRRLGRLGSGSSGLRAGRGGARAGPGSVGGADEGAGHGAGSVGGAGGAETDSRQRGPALAGRAPRVTGGVALVGHPNSLSLCVLISKMWVIVESTSQRYYGDENLRRDRGWRNRGLEEESQGDGRGSHRQT